jgi:hypothetical protein
MFAALAVVLCLPSAAFAKRLLGQGSPLMVISPQTLYGQMEQLGWLATTDKDQTAKKLSVGGQKVRVLHWKLGVIEGSDDEKSSDDDDDSILQETGL